MQGSQPGRLVGVVNEFRIDVDTGIDERVDRICPSLGGGFVQRGPANLISRAHVGTVIEQAFKPVHIAHLDCRLKSHTDACRRCAQLYRKSPLPQLLENHRQVDCHPKRRLVRPYHANQLTALGE